MLAAFFLLLTDALLPQPRLESIFFRSIAASCPGRKVLPDKDLTRACARYLEAVREGKTEANGSAVTFYASLESAEPAPVAGIARVSPASRAERAVGDLFPRTCRFNRAGVAAALIGPDEALVCALTADHQADLAHIPGTVE